jgi:hypothetical protein
MRVDEFLRKYKYKKTIVFLLGWKNIERAPYEGNCTDFAWTVALLEAGSVWKLVWWTLTLRAVFWLTWSEKNTVAPRHTILYVRGKGYIDSTYRYWRPNAIHTRVLPLLPPWPWFRALWGKLA